jgi:PAS domain S-box-containing protein
MIILLLDSKGVIQYVNPHFERLTGFQLDEVRGKDWFETFLPSRDRERIRTMFGTSYAGEHVRGNINPIVTRTGEERAIEWTDEMLRDGEGRIMGLLAIGQDVTERTIAQDALRRSEQRLAEAHRIANIGAWEVDLRTGGNWWSDEQYRMHGVPLGTPTTQDLFFSLVHPGDRGLIDQEYARTLATGEGELEFRVVRSDGEVRTLHGRAKTLYDEQGKPVKLVGTNQDITERKRAEAQLHASVAAREQLVDELREADRRKNDFIAVLSHELRNPLSAIRNRLLVLDRIGSGTEPARRTIDIVDRQLTQLSRLVDDLLDISRITQNKIHLRRTPLDLNQLVRAVIDDYQGLFASHGVRLQGFFAESPVIVDGDPARLTQVVGNLLHNAVKFTPSGGRTDVSLAADVGAGRVVLRVADTGAGMEPTMIDRVFLPFAQADRTLARSSGGLGLGLTLVKTLVELHGGDIGVRSEGLGRGTEFVVHLPLAEPSQRAVAQPVSESGSIPRRVLLVEDNIDAAETMRDVLELDSHTVEVAPDGEAGVRMAHDFRPDVLLCDLGLPGISGYDVARAIKRDPALQSTLLVAVSGYAAPSDVAQARAAGFDHHLAKPVGLERLRAVIASATGAHAS